MDPNKKNICNNPKILVSIFDGFASKHPVGQFFIFIINVLCSRFYRNILDRSLTYYLNHDKVAAAFVDNSPPLFRWIGFVRLYVKDKQMKIAHLCV